MKKYIFLIKNSFLENNLHFVSTLFSFLEPIFELIGFVFLYSFLQNRTAGLNQQVVVYFVTIFCISSIRPKNIMSFIKKDFKDEKFLSLNQRPINPFIYYFCMNIGKSLISLGIGVVLGVSVLIYYKYTFQIILLFIPSILLSAVLLNLIFFLISTLRFRMKYFSNTLYHVIIEFLSGKLIPITFFPIAFLTALKFLPFIYASGLIAKNISEEDSFNLVISLGIVLVWIFIVMKLGIKAWFSGSNAYQEKI